MTGQVWQWLTTAAHWHGGDGIPSRLLEHLYYCLLTLIVAAVIAIPLGSWIAHRGRGRWLVSVANSLRAVPSLGLLYVVSLWLVPRISGTKVYTISSIIVLVVLAIPPLLAGAFSGVSEVDPAARDAARGMGMTGVQVFGKVELPCALPLIFSGVRSATLQVVATTTIAASVGVGGLGRYLIDGLAQNNYPKMAAGAILVAVLALLVDVLLAGVQRLVVSPGLGGGPGASRSSRSARPRRRGVLRPARQAQP